MAWCHFVEIQNGTLHFCISTIFPFSQICIFVFLQNCTLQFCRNTKMHIAFLYFYNLAFFGFEINFLLFHHIFNMCWCLVDVWTSLMKAQPTPLYYSVDSCRLQDSGLYWIRPQCRMDWNHTGWAGWHQFIRDPCLKLTADGSCLVVFAARGSARAPCLCGLARRHSH